MVRFEQPYANEKHSTSTRLLQAALGDAKLTGEPSAQFGIQRLGTRLYRDAMIHRFIKLGTES